MNETTSIGALDLRTREALRFVAANALQSVSAGILVAGVLVFLLRDSIRLWPALMWLIALTVIGALRLGLRSGTALLPADASAQGAHLHKFTLHSFVSGLVWASAPWALNTQGDHELQSLVLFTCAAIGTGGAFASLASLRTAFAIFLPPMLAPVLFALLNPSRLNFIVGGVALVLGAVLARMLFVLNRQFAEQVDLRQRNAQLLAALQQRTADAEAANEAKSRFLVAASHDLRQPMHAIAIRSHALLEQSLPPEVQAIAARLDQSVVAMQSLFDALLDISKFDTGSVQLQIAPFALQPLFQKLLDGYSDVALEHSVTLHVSRSELWVNSDAQLIERVLRQWLDNAMRHAAGSSVHLSANQDSDDIIIEVRDTGKGISQEQQRTIFKEFVQLENPERDRRKGLGLGLAIVERIALQLGHRLELKSDPGQGACFRVYVPAAQPVVAPASADRSAAKTLPATPAPTPQNVLIGLLDDDPDVLDAMNLLLTRWQCEVIAASHSRELIEALSQQTRPADLLICDYRLAEERNGRQVIEELHRIYGPIPALLISGDIRAIEKDGDVQNITLLRKPVPPELLREMIASHTGKGETLRARHTKH